ncbi:CPBP family intramembrane glutamic endopeptidase [Pediococcus acidilactici]|nr:CPBP family intramembrane glutamic endopeptidase [Pediococcus acidilactici]
MPIVILTLSNAFVNIIFQLALPIKNPSLFGISSNNWNSLVTSTLAILIWLLINQLWLKIPVTWRPARTFRQLGYLLPILIVLIGDSTLGAHFNFTLAKILIAIGLGLTTGILEEYIFRGLLVTHLKTLKFSSLLVALLSGGAFALVHLINALNGNLLNTLAQVLAAFALGFFFAIVYLITGNLWLPILGHSIIDTFDQLAFSTLSNTSGTSIVTGLIYCVAFFAIGLIVWHKRLRNSHEKIFQRPVQQTKEASLMNRQPLTINKNKLIIAILIPLLELIIGGTVANLIPSMLGKILFTDLIFFIGFLVAILLYKDVLKRDWPRFKQHLWRNLLFAILGVVAAYLLLSVTRSGLKLFLSASLSSETLLSFAVSAPALGFLGSLTALMAPLSEEIIFRHALFYQWKNRGLTTWLMFILSSVLFGLIHWNNFNGDLLQMIPYMFVGAGFAVIYYKSQNIWQNITTHFFFDFIQVLAAGVMLIVSLLQ